MNHHEPEDRAEYDEAANTETLLLPFNHKLLRKPSIWKCTNLDLSLSKCGGSLFVRCVWWKERTVVLEEFKWTS